MTFPTILFNVFYQEKKWDGVQQYELEGVSSLKVDRFRKYFDHNVNFRQKCLFFYILDIGNGYIRYMFTIILQCITAA